MGNKAAQVKKVMKDKDLKKDTGYSWAELNNKLHYFSASNCIQFQESTLHEVLDGLTEHLFDAGYVPD